jgi:DNA-binding LacI/PurR family transcriptional regulator
MNMRTIAEMAGVSSATVSRVINGSSSVRADTAKRVQEILERVNFIPNPSATTLKYGRSKTFGLIIPDICNPFYSEFLGAFEELLVEVDHEVLMKSVQTDEMLIKSIRRMLMRRVDGVVMMASEFDTQAIEPLLLHKIPLVTVDRRTVSDGCSDVSTDFESGFVQAVVHLRELGHERIGYLGGITGLQTSQARSKAFRRAMKRAGLVFRPEFTRVGDYRVTGGVEAVISLMAVKTRPTAILTANDLTAFGAMRGLHTLGLSAPHDLSIVGVDDVLLTQVVQPPLTTIRIPRKRLATACILALNHTKEDVERMGKQFSVPTELIVRESTARLRKGKRKAK